MGTSQVLPNLLKGEEVVVDLRHRWGQRILSWEVFQHNNLILTNKRLFFNKHAFFGSRVNMLIPLEQITNMEIQRLGGCLLLLMHVLILTLTTGIGYLFLYHLFSSYIVFATAGTAGLTVKRGGHLRFRISRIIGRERAETFLQQVFAQRDALVNELGRR